jgi:hypothetical protein
MLRGGGTRRTGIRRSRSWCPRYGLVILLAASSNIGDSWPGRYCSAHHRMSFNSRHEGPECMSVTRRALGLADIARHVIGCHVTRETRVQGALDDMASNLCQALIPGGRLGGGSAVYNCDVRGHGPRHRRRQRDMARVWFAGHQRIRRTERRCRRRPIRRRFPLWRPVVRHRAGEFLRTSSPRPTLNLPLLLLLLLRILFHTSSSASSSSFARLYEHLPFRYPVCDTRVSHAPV